MLLREANNNIVKIIFKIINLKYKVNNINNSIKKRSHMNLSNFIFRLFTFIVYSILLFRIIFPMILFRLFTE